MRGGNHNKPLVWTPLRPRAMICLRKTLFNMTCGVMTGEVA
jgi:hypothetical protein